MMTQEYAVYAKTDEKRNIMALNSSAFVEADWGVEIDRGTSDRYHHAQGNYLSGPLYTYDGLPRYKLVDGQPVERTEVEIAADRAALPPPPPTDTEVLNALLGVSGNE